MNDAPWTNLNVLCQLCAEVTGKESSLLLLVKKLAVAKGHILRRSPFYLLSSASCPAP